MNKLYTQISISSKMPTLHTFTISIKVWLNCFEEKKHKITSVYEIYCYFFGFGQDKL